MTPNTESWLPVVGYEGLYEVSDHGRVRSLDRTLVNASGQRRFYRGRVLKPANDQGYLVVTLCSDEGRKNRPVHQLIAEIFVGPCPEGLECLHGDGNPHNNRPDNLSWGTQADNAADRIRHGRQPMGTGHAKSKLTDDDILLIRKFRPMFTLKQLAEAFDVHLSLISNICLGKTWRHV